MSRGKKEIADEFIEISNNNDHIHEEVGITSLEHFHNKYNGYSDLSF